MIEPQSQLRFHKAAKTAHVTLREGMSQRSASRGFRELDSGWILTITMKRRCAASLTGPAATAETASGRPRTTARICWVGPLTGIAAHADASEVGVGHIVVTSGRRWFLCCNLAGGRLGKPAKDYDEQGLPDILWRACPQRRCPRNNTWHRPKLSTALRDRSVRTQCTSLSHGGARAPEKTLRPLSEDKTASTVQAYAYT